MESTVHSYIQVHMHIHVHVQGREVHVAIMVERLLLYTTATDLLILWWLCSDGESTHTDYNTHRHRDNQRLEKE